MAGHGAHYPGEAETFATRSRQCCPDIACLGAVGSAGEQCPESAVWAALIYP